MADTANIPDDSEPLTSDYQLAYPRRIDGKAYSTIRLRHPTAGDMLKVYAGEDDAAKRARKMLMTLSGIPETHLDRLHAFDYLKLNRMVEGFLFDGPGAQKAASLEQSAT